MIYTAVEAKQFDAVGFEPSTSTLGVKFKARGGGKVPASEYVYSNVEEQVYDALMGSNDKDEFFNNPDARQPRTKDFLNKILQH